MQNIDNIITEQINKFLKENLDNDMDIISAASYIFGKNQNNKWCVLCGKRASNDYSCPNMWNVPVGHREYTDKTAQICAQREVQEESGVNIPLNMFKFVEREIWGKGKVGSNFLVILNDNIEHYPIGQGDGECTNYQWLPIENVDKLQWAYNMNKTLLQYFSKYIQ